MVIRMTRNSNNLIVMLQAVILLLLTYHPFPAAGTQQTNLHDAARGLYLELVSMSKDNMPVTKYQDTIAYYSGELERLKYLQDRQRISTSPMLNDSREYLDAISELLIEMEERFTQDVRLNASHGKDKPAETIQYPQGFAARNLELLVSAGILIVLLIIMVAVNKNRLSTPNKKEARRKQVKPKSNYQIKKELFASGKEKGKIKI